MHSFSMFGFALLLLATTAFFNLAEMALVAVRPARLGSDASASANHIWALKKRPGLFLAAVRAGDRITDLITGAFIVTWVERELHQALSKLPVVGPYASSVGSIVAFLGVTYVFLVIADLMPKALR